MSSNLEDSELGLLSKQLKQLGNTIGQGVDQEPEQGWLAWLWPFSRFYDYERRLYEQRKNLRSLGREYTLELARRKDLEERMSTPKEEVRRKLRTDDELIRELSQAAVTMTRCLKARRDQLRAANIEPAPLNHE